ncbi:MAG: hypothetical protein CMO61_11735 [Verrucomicrobiales bacterium]|jgi:hypothetical protein|nr:hypothetical protein [Verrucomicrobiales bacterium]
MRNTRTAADLIPNVSESVYISHSQKTHAIEGMSMDLLIKKTLNNNERTECCLHPRSHLLFRLSLCRDSHSSLVMKTKQDKIVRYFDCAKRWESYFKFI